MLKVDLETGNLIPKIKLSRPTFDKLSINNLYTFDRPSNQSIRPITSFQKRFYSPEIIALHHL